MRRALYIALALSGLTGSGTWFYTQWWVPNNSYEHFTTGVINPFHPVWIQLVGIFLPLTVGVTFTVLACSSNIYHIKHGEVIDHRFTRAYTIPGSVIVVDVDNVPVTSITPSVHVPDQYEIQLRRERDGRTGWVTVSETTYRATRVGQIFGR